MLKYLIVPLSNDAVSFCYYNRDLSSNQFIDLNILRDIIFWSLKENLNIQFLYPDFKLPDEYHELIDTVDHTTIVNSTCEDANVLANADVVVFDSWTSTNDFPYKEETTYVIRTNKDDFFLQKNSILSLLSKVDSLQIIITDLKDFTNSDFCKYKKILENLVPTVANEIARGRNIHFNLLTSRVLLDSMNNCNAGEETIAVSTNGTFYPCPAFFTDNSNEHTLGTVEKGLNIKNPQLYRLSHAPLCRNCDAFQCRRCVWLNKETTLEINTPSHEQCVIAHIERNASKKLSDTLRKLPEFNSLNEIKTIDYLDPFDLLEFPRAK